MSSIDVDLTTEQAAILNVDHEIVSALNSRNADGFLGFLTHDARMQPPNAPILQGKDAIRELLEELFALPGFTVTHGDPDRIVVSQSRDLAYISYAYSLTVPNEDGGSVTEEGKDISIYQKQVDGNWKLTVDMWSSNRSE